MTNDQSAKIKTLVWFDVFDWPLTALEIKKYTPNKNLSKPPENTSDAIENLNGFYFLKGRKEIVKKRILRQKIAIQKIKIAKFAAEILSFVPFVRMVAVCNDLAYFNAPEDSDIDFFVVVKSGRMWTARFLATFIIFVLGLWRHRKKIKDRICLSFFIADDNLNLKEIAYENDIYLKFWILQILPLFDRNDTPRQSKHGTGQAYQKFLKENFWVMDEFPNFFPNFPVQKIKIKQKLIQIVFEKILNGWLGNFLEKILKNFQLKIMGKKKPFQKEKDVIISDKILKFHENDRRKYFRNIFNQRLTEIREHS